MSDLECFSSPKAQQRLLVRVVSLHDATDDMIIELMPAMPSGNAAILGAEFNANELRWIISLDIKASKYRHVRTTCSKHDLKQEISPKRILVAVDSFLGELVSDWADTGN